MSMSESKSLDKLFTDFPPSTFTDWQEKLENDLKGKDPARLNWKTPAGFSLQPMYSREHLAELEKSIQLQSAPGQFPFVRGHQATGKAFEIRQPVHAASIAEANTIALDVLNRGADSVEFLSQVDFSSDGYRRQGIALESADDLANLLKGIYVDAAPLHLRTGLASAAVLEYLKEFIKLNSFDAGQVQGSMNFDIYASLITGGALPGDLPAMYQAAADLAAKTRLALPAMRVLGVDAHLAAERGAGPVQELAYGLAAGSDLMAGLMASGMEARHVASQLHFNFSTGSSYFLEMARLRAARLLWARILEAYNSDAADTYAMRITSRTALHNKTRYDAHNNMLRVTTESMAAILGGCDSLVVQGLHATQEGTPYDDFADRMARNTALVVRHESYLEKVADPAAGSYYIEILTNQLSVQVWEAFQAIEKAGGLGAVLPDGSLQQSWAENAIANAMAVGSRKQSVVGTNQFPNAEESLAEIKDNDARAKQALPVQKIEMDLSDYGLKGSGPTVATVPAMRSAQGFETLRLQTETYQKKNGQRPHVFLYTFGNMTMRRARAGFAANFFGCAGYSIIDNPGFEPAGSGLDKLKKSAAQLIVLCSSDEEYAEAGVQLIKEIKASQADTIIVIAGSPECLPDLQAAGAHSAIHIKTDVLKTLEQFQKDLGVS